MKRKIVLVVARGAEYCTCGDPAEQRAIPTSGLRIGVLDIAPGGEDAPDHLLRLLTDEADVAAVRQNRCWRSEKFGQLAC